MGCIARCALRFVHAVVINEEYVKVFMVTHIPIRLFRMRCLSSYFFDSLVGCVNHDFHLQYASEHMQFPTLLRQGDLPACRSSRIAVTTRSGTSTNKRLYAQRQRFKHLQALAVAALTPL